MSFSFGSPTTTSANTFGTTTQSTENKPAFNFSSPTNNAPAFGGFSFGAKTTAAAPSLFGTPATTNAGSAFGTVKPQGFEGMMSPPNQTVGSPGFGQPAAQNTAQNLSFGGAVQQQPAASAFGSPAQAAPGTFGSPTTGFGFGKPATTSATSAFSFATPASGFSAPQQPAAVTSTPVPGAFSFGGNTTAFAPATTASAAPTFGTGQSGLFAAQQAPSQPQTGLTFGSTGQTFGANTAPTFGANTAPTFGANTGPTFGGTTTASPGFGSQPTGFQSQPAVGFGSTVSATAATTAQSSLPFGTNAPTQTSTLSFGVTPTTSQPTGLTFGQTNKPAFSAPPSTATAAPLKLGFASTQPSMSFGTTTTPSMSLGTTAPTTSTLNPTPSTGLSFGTTPATTGLSFSTAGTTQSAAFGVPATQATSQALSFGTPATKSGLSFGAPASTSQVATTAVTSLSFSAVTSASQPGTAFGVTSAPSTQSGLAFSAPTTSAGLSFGANTTVPASSTATTTPSGITALGKSTAVTTAVSLTTATTTTAAQPPAMITSITFAQLEENINKWTLDLEEQEKTFINQATQINAWDRLLIANGEKIIELNDAVQNVKNEQQSLEHELEFVVSQQKELEDLLAPMEKQLLEEAGDRMRDPEREHMYSLAENLDTQLRQMSEDLKEVIEHLNETNRSQDSNDPIVQIGRILNAHMSSMQWIDNSIAQISTKLDQLKTTHDTLRRDNERSFQLTYN